MSESTPSPAPFWRRHPREAVALGGIAAAIAIAAGGSAWSSPSIAEIEAAQAEKTAPAPPPLLVRKLAPTDAATMNGQIPLSGGPNPAAQPFSTSKLDSITRAQALECLAQAVYYEAGQEPDEGQRGVAQVVLNRVRHPAFPSSVCGVVYQGSTRSTGCQFTFTCDGSLMRQPSAASWARARRVAEAALSGSVYGPVGLATHYHANYVVPYWAATLAKNAVVGAHLFYRWAGGWGRPAAFTQAYSRTEPSAAALRSTALTALASRPVEAVEEQVAEIPGAEVGKNKNGLIAVRFKLEEARQAVEEAPKLAYVEKVEASDNLRWTLSGSKSEVADQKPLGRAAPEQATN